MDKIVINKQEFSDLYNKHHGKDAYRVLAEKYNMAISTVSKYVKLFGLTQKRIIVIDD